MQLNKIRISEQSDNALRHLKARTGLTPNLLCRIGFCLSLRDITPVDLNNYDDTGREFNRYTLTGQWDTFFLAILKERLEKEGLPMEAVDDQFIAHINRGILYLFQRVKNLVDLYRLIVESNITQAN